MQVNFDDFQAILLDLDGTVYHEEHPLPGAVELIHRLQRENRTFACISNATTSPGRIRARLAGMKIELEEARIYTAGAAACDYVLGRFSADSRRPRAYNLATEGVHEMLDAQVDWVEDFREACDGVIVGAPANVFATFDRQRVALELLRRGALLVAICNDRIYPSPRGLEFGSGALTAMLAYAATADPVFCGKPEPIFFHELCQRLRVEPSRCLLIGDNLEADITGARRMGMRTILTLSGVTRSSDLLVVASEMRPDAVVEDLRELL